MDLFDGDDWPDVLEQTPEISLPKLIEPAKVDSADKVPKENAASPKKKA